MRASSKVLSVAFAAALTGCATTEFVEVSPECSVPPVPSPPEIPAEALSTLPDETYWRVRERDAALIDAILERQAMLRELCGGDSGESDP